MVKHDVKVGKLDYCQITGSRNLFEAIDLGFQPPCGTLLTKDTLGNPETYYPLKLMVCPESGLGQIDYVLGNEFCFPVDYPYRPGISAPLVEHLKKLAESVIFDHKLKPRSLVVDVGSNDGTLLTFFKKRGMRVLGVEPTNMAKVANEVGVETIQDFFNERVAKKIVKKYGPAKVITMTNVFAHMATLGEVMRSMAILLDKKGVVVSESQYLLDVFERNQFDEIYHDHIRIYSLKSLTKLFPYYDMEVFDAKRVQTREGSIEVRAGWRGKHPIKPIVKKLLKLEEEADLFSPVSWAKFRQRVSEQKNKFLLLLLEVKKKGLTLVADSCPTRGVVLLNYYNLSQDTLPYVSQLPGTEKVGKYIPGTHNPIISNEIILKEQPDYILILAWHYDDYIIKNWKAKGVKSKFIIPLPKFKII
jgi:23S rRNA U2552 (ribose-2'-O)-methylase RlmE/FtsJ